METAQSALDVRARRRVKSADGRCVEWGVQLRIVYICRHAARQSLMDFIHLGYSERYGRVMKHSLDTTVADTELDHDIEHDLGVLHSSQDCMH